MLLNEKKTIEKAYAFLSKDPVMKFFIHSFGDEIDALDRYNDNFAIAYDYWWNTRNEKVYAFNPSKSGNVSIITDRNYQDNYSDPGDFIKEKNKYNKSVIKINSRKAYLIGQGYSKKGQFPFCLLYTSPSPRDS